MLSAVSVGVEFAQEALSVDSLSFHTPQPITEKVRTRRFSLVNPFTWFSNDVQAAQKEEEVEEEVKPCETKEEINEDEKLIAGIMAMFKANKVNEMEKVLEEEIEKTQRSEQFEEKNNDEYEYIDEFAYVTRLPRKKSVRFDKTVDTPARPFTPMFTSTPQSTHNTAASMMSIENSTILTNASISSAIKNCAPAFNYDILTERSKCYYHICDVSDEEEQPIRSTFVKGEISSVNEEEEDDDEQVQEDSDEESANLNCSATFVISPMSSSEEDELVFMESHEESEIMKKGDFTDVFEDSNWTNNSSLISMGTTLPEIM